MNMSKNKQLARETLLALREWAEIERKSAKWQPSAERAWKDVGDWADGRAKILKIDLDSK